MSLHRPPASRASALIHSLLPLFLFILFGLAQGAVFIHQIGALSFPDTDIHANAAYATATGQMFNPVEQQADAYGNVTNVQSITGEARYLSRGGMRNEVVEAILKDYPHLGDPSRGAQEAASRETTGVITVPSPGASTNRSNQYFFLGYLPQALGFNLANTTGQSPYAHWQMARWINLIVFLLLGSCAIAMAPGSKYLFALLLLQPPLLFIASSLMVDGSLAVVAALAIATVMRAAGGFSSAGKVRGRRSPCISDSYSLSSSRKHTSRAAAGALEEADSASASASGVQSTHQIPLSLIVIFGLCSAYLITEKFVYGTVALLFLLLPSHRLSVRRKLVLYSALTAILVFAALWTSHFAGLLAIINVGDAARNLLAHPLTAASALLSNLIYWIPRTLLRRNVFTLILLGSLLVALLASLLVSVLRKRASALDSQQPLQLAQPARSLQPHQPAKSRQSLQPAQQLEEFTESGNFVCRHRYTLAAVGIYLLSAGLTLGTVLLTWNHPDSLSPIMRIIGWQDRYVYPLLFLLPLIVYFEARRHRSSRRARTCVKAHADSVAVSVAAPFDDDVRVRAGAGVSADIDASAKGHEDEADSTGVRVIDTSISE